MINKKEKIINDPVHGIINLEEFAIDIINTRYFQRLHHVRQLDIAYLVYPGAMHTRFEHCIGTYYITRKLLESLNLENTKYANIIKVSALIHDIGHGPFSHQYDSCRVDKFQHEERASVIIKKMSEEITNPETKKYFTPENIKLICRIINGNDTIIQDGHKTPDCVSVNCDDSDEENDNNELNHNNNSIDDDVPNYVFEIVSNHYNGIDVDRFDYIIRDSYYTGVCTSFNLQRILQVAELRNGHMVFPKKDFYTIFLFFQARYILHKLVYQHKTVICYGKVLRQIIKRHINQIRALEWEDQTDENLLYLMRATDAKFKKIKKYYPTYEEFKKNDIKDIIKKSNLYLTPEQIKDLTYISESQYNEIGEVGADNILYRVPVYKIAKKIVLKRLDVNGYHHLVNTDKFYKIQNGKPKLLDEEEVCLIHNNNTILMEAINDGLYVFTEPMDSSYEIKDEVSFGFGVPSQSFYKNILFFDKDEPDECNVKSFEELHESACLPQEWFEYSINYYSKINKV
ncbi:hypothetical protein BCR36DRAFT_344157 [Piromyces finnis]|uniref:HD/PDEase domain-containing protein n=1 Tax=Piromyces finnis TaxID=1754191 RepID=A0A1Y1VIY6_9FUNG|nr:hypothetical protein BCR36DRAFT_344157 [Piromyces finnis]|eukprot:ORX57680.1 hypothetical protein BCR36DRAFT_344157 [Piromyces finnis]